LLLKKLNGTKESEIALDLVGGLAANAIQNTKSSSQESVQRK
jgi:hypothetical protein